MGRLDVLRYIEFNDELGNIYYDGLGLVAHSNDEYDEKAHEEIKKRRRRKYALRYYMFKLNRQVRFNQSSIETNMCEKFLDHR